MKRITFRYYRMVPWICLLLFSSAAFAFKDIDEPNDSFDQVHTTISVDNPNRQQYTLHSRDDEDWFQFYAHKEVRYEFTAFNVGNHVNVAIEMYHSEGKPVLDTTGEIVGVGECCNGKQKFFDWTAPADSVYYLKVSDMAGQSDDCRLNIQYELKIHEVDLPTQVWWLRGMIKDTFSNALIQNAAVQVCTSDEEKTTASGEYSLTRSCNNSTFALTVIASGYKTLICHFPIAANSEVTKNIALIPVRQTPSIQPVSINSSDKLVPSQTLYHNGDRLRVGFPLFPLPENICIRYHLGMHYPDGRLFIIKRFNEMELFNPSALPHWIGIGEWVENWSGIGEENEKNGVQVVIDMPVNDSLPRGDYALYLLRMPGYVEDPIKDLHLGELNVANFRVE